MRVARAIQWPLHPARRNQRSNTTRRTNQRLANSLFASIRRKADGGADDRRPDATPTETRLDQAAVLLQRARRDNRRGSRKMTSAANRPDTTAGPIPSPLLVWARPAASPSHTTPSAANGRVE